MGKLTGWAMALGAAALLAGAPAGAAPQPEPKQSDFETGLLTVPIYPVIKQYYPETYARILKAGLDGYTQGRTVMSLQADMRAIYLPLLQSQMPKAEPRLVFALIRITRDEAEPMAATPDACMAFFGLSKFKQRLDLLINPDLAQKELTLTAELLKQTATHPYAYDPSQVAQLPTAQTLATIAYDELPSDDSRRRFAKMDGRLADATDPADQRVVCEYMVGFFSALLKQTPEDAGALFTGIAKR